MDKRKVVEILKRLRERLEVIYGDNLLNIVLYGSWARGEATDDSDIDVAVVLKEMVSSAKEIERMIDVVTDLNLEYDVLISVYPVSENSFLNVRSPLLLNIREEGISV